MKTLFPSPVQLRLAQLSSHLLVALVALVVIGGATRVMDAGLACPDWPLCFGSLLPGKQMNLQVFLEWFHRLDAFLIGLVLFVQFVLSLYWRPQLQNWLPWAYGGLVVLVGIQGALGALTVLDLLPSFIVIAHLLVALTLVAAISAITQILLSSSDSLAPIWWRLLGVFSLISLIIQSLLGSRVATSWAAQRCLRLGDSCQLLELHKITAIPVTLFVLIFVFSGFLFSHWLRKLWLYLLGVVALISLQVTLGIFSISVGLTEPLLVIAHQLVAALLIASISALIFKGPNVVLSGTLETIDSPNLETCNG